MFLSLSIFVSVRTWARVLQTDNKKNSVPQSVSQSVQTDNEKNSVPQTVTQSAQAHDEEWQEVVTV